MLDGRKLTRGEMLAQLHKEVVAVGELVIEQRVKPFVRAVKAMQDSTHRSLAPRIYGDDYRRHRRFCCLCNPAGNPKALRVNGADYTRRTRSRRRRNRR